MNPWDLNLVYLLVIDILLVLALSTQSEAGAGLSRRILTADASELPSLAERVKIFTQEHPSYRYRTSLYCSLARAWYNYRQFDDALGILDRLVREGRTESSWVWLLRAMIHAERGQDEAVEKALLHELQEARPKSRLRARGLAGLKGEVGHWLGPIYEKRQKWKLALHYYEASRIHGFSDGCGNAQLRHDFESRMAISRCQFHLGQVDQALKELWQLLNAQYAPDHLHSESVLQYLQFAARCKRLDEANDKVQLLKGKRQATFRALLGICDAYLSNGPREIVRLVETSDKRSQYHSLRLGARLLKDLQQTAIPFLEKKIWEGHAPSIALAGMSGFRSLMPSLRGRLRIEQDTRIQEKLRRALDQLRSR